MMSGLSAAEQEETWREIEGGLGQFESAEGFAGPFELLIGAGVKE